jgi:hypothetical protein
LGAQKFLADNNYGPAGDGFYEFQKEHQTVQELKKQVTELAAEEGQSLLLTICDESKLWACPDCTDSWLRVILV